MTYSKPPEAITELQAVCIIIPPYHFVLTWNLEIHLIYRHAANVLKPRQYIQIRPISCFHSKLLSKLITNYSLIFLSNQK